MRGATAKHKGKERARLLPSAKRARHGAGLSGPAEGNAIPPSGPANPASPFLTLLQECGAQVSEGRVLLHKELAAFRRELMRRVQSMLPESMREQQQEQENQGSPTLEAVVSSFLDWAAEDLEHLRAALLPVTRAGRPGGREPMSATPQTLRDAGGTTTTTTSSSSSPMAGGLRIRDSLVRMLLAMEGTQVAIAHGLLDRLPEFFEEVPLPATASLHDNLPKLIIHQFRWLDQLVDPEALVAKFLDILELASTPVQLQLLEALPEILVDSQVDRVAVPLRDLMHATPSLTVPILHVIANLDLSPSILEDIQRDVLPKLASCSADDLPVIIRFLFQSSASPSSLALGPAAAAAAGAAVALPLAGALPEAGSMTSATVLLHEFRQHFEFASVFAVCDVRRQGTSTSLQQQEQQRRGELFLVFDALKSIASYPALVDGWLKLLSSKANRWRPLDIVLLLTLYSIPTLRRKVDACAKRALRQGLVSADLFQATLSTMGPGFYDYYQAPLLALAECLLCCGTPAHVAVARVLYVTCFRALGGHRRQDIVGTLMTHAGSGLEAEVSAALDILLALAQDQPAALAKLAIFLTSILDYVDHLADQHVRQMFGIFAELVVHHLVTQGGSGGGGGRAGDPASDPMAEVHMYLQKQVGCLDPRFKRIGVLGSMAMLCRLGREQERECIRLCLGLLQAIQSSCRADPACLTQALDVLSFTLGRGSLHPKVLDWVYEHIALDFHNHFLRDAAATAGESGDTAPSPLPELRFARALALDAEGDMDVSIAPLLLGEPAQLLQLRVLCPLWKLLQTCERAKEGSLAQIDLLLEAGLVLFAEQGSQDTHVVRTELSRDGRHALLSSLYFAVNWLRELLNAFAPELQRDPATIPAMFTRIQQVQELEARIDPLLPLAADWAPDAIFTMTTGPAVIEYLAEDPDAADADAESARQSAEADGDGEGTAPAPSTIAPSIPASPSRTVGSARADRKERLAAIPLVGGRKRGRKPGAKAALTLATLRARHMRELNLVVFALLPHGLEDRERLPGILFLLKDLHTKVRAKFPPATSGLGRRARPALPPSSTLDMLPVRECLAAVLGTLPALMRHLDACIASFRSAKAVVEAASAGSSQASREDAPTEEQKEEDRGSVVMANGAAGDVVADLDQGRVQCFARIATLITDVLAGSELVRDEHADLLLQALGALRLADSPAPDATTATQASQGGGVEGRAIQAFLALEVAFPHLPTGALYCAYYRCLHGLAAHAGGALAVRERLAAHASTFLATPSWVDERAIAPEELQAIIQHAIRHHAEPGQAVEELLATAIPGLKRGDEEVLIKFPLLTRETLLSFYRASLLELVQVMGAFHPDAIADAAACNEERIPDVLEAVFQLVTCFKAGVEVIRLFDHRALLAILLKQSSIFLQHFAKRVCPVFKAFFCEASDDIVAILKCLQQGTRILQSVCGESKVSGDSMLMAHVPGTRRVLESLLFEVKKLLEENHSLNAFWVGNLKHRALDGSVISSQMPRYQESEDEEEGAEEGEGELTQLLDIGAIPAASESSDDDERVEEDADLARDEGPAEGEGEEEEDEEERDSRRAALSTEFVMSEAEEGDDDEDDGVDEES